MNSDLVKRIVREGKIEYVGITHAYEDTLLKERLKNRYEKGYITEFENNDIERRSNPSRVFEGAKSIIVVLFPYKAGSEAEDSNLSAYCRGTDYHVIAKRALEEIGERLKRENDELEYHVFCDTSDLVDRHMAWRAGLGFYGLNNNLINESYGSYFFIGGLAVNIELECDSPLERGCLECGLCIEKCPGKALKRGYEMDVHRCASYITQKKGELKEDEQSIIKRAGFVFGCDICQSVCPHNRGIEDTYIEEFKEGLISTLQTEQIDAVSQKGFRREYGDRAFSWRGKNILKRNIELLSEEENNEE